MLCPYDSKAMADSSHRFGNALTSKKEPVSRFIGDVEKPHAHKSERGALEKAGR
jgi:hypothetical protein